MAYSYIVNEELNKINFNEESNKLDLNTDNSFNIKSIINFIIDNYKQFLLLLLAVLIILVVDHITYYNNLFYAMAPVIPQPQPQPQQKSNTFKKKTKKFKI
jgi:hypothetical protein